MRMRRLLARGLYMYIQFPSFLLNDTPGRNYVHVIFTRPLGSRSIGLPVHWVWNEDNNRSVSGSISRQHSTVSPARTRRDGAVAILDSVLVSCDSGALTLYICKLRLHTGPCTCTYTCTFTCTCPCTCTCTHVHIFRQKC